MEAIKRATANDSDTIVSIGRISVAEAHQNSCASQDLDDYMGRNYNADAIKAELNDPSNLYHIIHHNNQPVGFSKIVLNAVHPNITDSNVAKLDRIYLLKAAQGQKLGWQLLSYNIGLAKANKQTAIWLYTWVGNQKAINFYTKTGFKIIGSHQFHLTETSSNLNHQMYLALDDQTNGSR